MVLGAGSSKWQSQDQNSLRSSSSLWAMHAPCCTSKQWEEKKVLGERSEFFFFSFLKLIFFGYS